MSGRRTFIKVDDEMPDHPKVVGLSDAAFRALVETWCWSNRNLTDGHVPAAVWKKRASARVARELTSAGLVEPADGGVQMHDYLDHQTSKAHVEHVRAERSAAGKKGGRPRKPRPNGTATPKPEETKLVSNLEPTPEARETQKEEVRSATALPNGSAGATCGDAAPPDQDALPGFPPAPVRPETVNQRAQRLARGYHQREPMSNFMGVVGVVKRALATERWADDEIGAALQRLADAGRSVSNNALRVECDGQPLRAVSGGYTPWQNPADPSAYHEEL